MKKTTALKSITMKVMASESKLQLFSTIRDYTGAAAEICDGIMTLSGRTLTNRDGEPILSSPELLAEQSKSKKIPLPTLTDHALGYYRVFMGDSMSRGHVGFLTAETTKSTNEHADFLREHGILPFSYKGIEYDVLDGQGGYKYGVVGSVHSRLRSWVECDAQTTTDWENLKTDLEEHRVALVKKYGKEVSDQLDAWLHRSKEFNFTLGKTGGKFMSFFKNTLWESLKEGKPLSYGTWTTTQGNKIEYSCPPEVVESLFKEYPELWNVESPILDDGMFANYVEKVNDFERKKQYASYTRPDLMNSPVRLLTGNNYVAIKKENGIVVDPKNKTLTITIKAPKSLHGENEKEWIQIPCAYGRFRKGKHNYFDNLTVTPILNEEGNPTGMYSMEFDVNGKRHRKAVVKEPSFRLVVRNSKIDINNPKMSDFDIYLGFPMNVEIQSAHNIPLDGLSKIRAELSRAYPESKPTEKQKTVTVADNIIVPDGMSVMGIDLGLRNPFAYSIYSFSSKGNHKYITSGVFTKDNSTVLNGYSAFNKACFNLKKLINSTRYYIQGDIKEVDGCWLDFLNQYLEKQVPGYTPYTMDEYNKWLKKHKNTPLVEFKRKKNEWIVSKIAWLIRGIFFRLSDQRNDTNHFTTHFYWISCNDMFKRVMRSWQKVGCDSSLKPPTGLSPFRSIKDRINNLKLDYLKKLAFEIAEIAKQNGVALVVTEKLENLRGNVYHDRDRNKLYNTWPVGQIKHYLENALLSYGILLCEADERHTSQVVSESGEWGYRDEKNANFLWWVDNNGNVYSTHADENAAKNITLRYLSRHTLQNSVRLAKITDVLYVPVTALKKDGSKRERGFLSRHFGTSQPVFELVNGFLVPSKKYFRDVVKKRKLEDLEKNQWYFINHSFKKLINKERRERIEDEIKEKAAKEKLRKG